MAHIEPIEKPLYCLKCDGCSIELGLVSQEPNDLPIFAKKAGWTFMRAKYDGRLLCPECMDSEQDLRKQG